MSDKLGLEDPLYSPSKPSVEYVAAILYSVWLVDLTTSSIVFVHGLYGDREAT